MFMGRTHPVVTPEVFSSFKNTYFWTMFQKTKIETRLIVNSGLVRSI